MGYNLVVVAVVAVVVAVVVVVLMVELEHMFAYHGQRHPVVYAPS